MFSLLVYSRDLVGFSFLKSAFSSVRETSSRRQIREEEGSLQKKSRQANISVLSGFSIPFMASFSTSSQSLQNLEKNDALTLEQTFYVHQKHLWHNCFSKVYESQ